MKVGTREFADAVIERMGQTPRQFATVEYDKDSYHVIEVEKYDRPTAEKTLVGSDLFIDDATCTPDELGQKLETLTDGELKLKMITNRGVKVYPDGMPETFCTDHWRCRFVNKENPKDVKQMKEVSKTSISDLLAKLLNNGVDVVKTENLYYFDGELGFSLGQGE